MFSKFSSTSGSLIVTEGQRSSSVKISVKTRSNFSANGEPSQLAAGLSIFMFWVPWRDVALALRVPRRLQSSSDGAGGFNLILWWVLTHTAILGKAPSLVMLHRAHILDFSSQACQFIRDTSPYRHCPQRSGPCPKANIEKRTTWTRQHGHGRAMMPAWRWRRVRSMAITRPPSPQSFFAFPFS